MDNHGPNQLEELLRLVRDLSERVRTLEERAQAQIIHKNRSSAMLREMTTEDARKVLAGDYAELDHTDAAAQLGLTYAQVYSCRLGYTFKPIHRQLEKTGWQSRWAPKRPRSRS